MSGITDLGTTLAWLDAAPQVHRAAFVVRFALRVLPGIALEQYALDEVALPVFRAALTSVVATAFPTPPVMGAAAVASSAHANVQKSFQRNASPQYYSEASRVSDKDVVDPTETGADAAAAVLLAARMASGTASDAIASVSSAAGFFRGDDNAGAAQAAYAAASKDAEYLERSGSASSLLQQPLWHDGKLPETFQQALLKLELVWIYDHTLRTFWKLWYRRMLEGKPLNWDLQRTVALIEDGVWDQGPEAVAERIREAEAESIAEWLPLAEEVTFDFETVKFGFKPVRVVEPKLIEACLSQIEDALDDALNVPSNGLFENSSAVRKLRRMLGRYQDDPQRIEMDAETVNNGLRRQIESEELPESEEILDLIRAVDETARAVRATHPDVARNRTRLSELRSDVAPQASLANADEIIAILQAISDEPTSEEWAEDIPRLMNDAIEPAQNYAPALPTVDVAARVGSRAAKIKSKMKIKEVIERIHSSAPYKFGDIISMLNSLVDLLISILP